MTARRKYVSPCSLTHCRCGHASSVHQEKDEEGPAACYASPPCPCKEYVLAKPAKKPAAKKARALARFGSAEPLPPVFKQGPCGLPPPAKKLSKRGLAALCAKCGHKRNWHRRYNVDDRCVPPIKGCACPCSDFTPIVRNRSKP